MKNVKVFIPLLDEINQLFATKQDGVNTAVETFLHLRRVALASLKGVFKPNELKAMCDAFNGTGLTKSIQHNNLLFFALMQDSNKYKGLYQKWEIETDFEFKILWLSELQVFFLQEELHRFWYGPGYGYPAPDLDRFVDAFK